MFASIVLIVFIAAIFFTWFFIHQSKVEERRLLIEKDIDFSKLPDRGVLNFNFPWLKVGCVITSATIGLIIGIVFFKMGSRIGGLPFVLAVLLGGIGMMIAHFMGNPKDKQ